MKNTTKGKALKCTAIGIDVAAPLAATISQFPVWVEKSSAATVSGLFLMLAFISAIPFIKQIKQWLKSPSVFVLWCILFISLALLRNIIDQIFIVSFVGLLSNGLGSLVYKAGGIIEIKPDETVPEGSGSTSADEV